MHAPLFNEPVVSGFDPMQVERAIPRPQTPWHLAPVGGKAVPLDCDGGRLSADAGLVLLKDLDAPLGVTRGLAAVLSDPRAPRRIHFTRQDLRKQRVLHMAVRDEDANDATTLRDDPLFTLLRARFPATGAPLASPPTSSRCAHRVSRTALSRLALVLLAPCLASDATPPTVIVLAVDDTEAPVHGPQAPARSDGDAGGSGVLPLHMSAGLSGRLLPTILQATRCTGTQRLAVVKRLGKRLRQAWPDPRVMVRGDSHCASPEVRQWLAEHPALSDVTGLTSHAV